MPKKTEIDVTLFLHAFIPVSYWIHENYVAEQAALEKVRKSKKRQFRRMTGRFFLSVQRKRRQNLRRHNNIRPARLQSES